MDPLKQKIKDTQLFTPQEKIDILATFDTISDEDKAKLMVIIDEYDAKYTKATHAMKTGLKEELDGIVRDAKPDEKDRMNTAAGKIKKGLDVVIPDGY